MGFANTGTRGEPFVASSGNPPTFAADLSGISTFFASRSFREFATVAAMVASTGSGANEWAKCDNAPGALYYNDGTRWHLGNTPVVANATARSALFTGTLQPDQGSGVMMTDTGIDWVFYATWNASTNPGGATPSGWYPAPGSDVFLHMDRIASQAIANNATAPVLGDSQTAGTFALGVPRTNQPMTLASQVYTNAFFSWDRSQGQLKPIIAADYDITAFVQWPVNSAGFGQAAVTKNSLVILDANTLAYDADAATATKRPLNRMTVKNAQLLTTDIVRLLAFNNAGGGTISFGTDAQPSALFFDIRYVGPTHA